MSLSLGATEKRLTMLLPFVFGFMFFVFQLGYFIGLSKGLKKRKEQEIPRIIEIKERTK
jgi:hypothetical protein